VAAEGLAMLCKTFFFHCNFKILGNLYPFFRKSTLARPIFNVMFARMSYTPDYTSSAKRQKRRIDGKYKATLDELIAQALADPDGGENVKSKPGARRYKKGRVRVVYIADDEARVVTFYEAGLRNEKTYKNKK